MNKRTTLLEIFEIPCNEATPTYGQAHDLLAKTEQMVHVLNILLLNISQPTGQTSDVVPNCSKSDVVLNCSKLEAFLKLANESFATLDSPT